MMIRLEAGRITIRRRDGTAQDGIVLACYGDTISVAIRDADDAALFTCVHGVWVSEDCEPVQIERWGNPEDEASDVDGLCSQGAAARLVQALAGDSRFDHEAPVHPTRDYYAPLLQRVV